MDDEAIEYYFDNIESFYSELDDVLNQYCADEKSAEKIFNQYIRFLVRFQHEFVQTTHEMAAVAYKLLDSTLFLEYSTTILSHLLHVYVLEAFDSNALYFSYSFLLHAGREDPRWMKYIVAEARSQQQNRLFQKMIPEIVNPMNEPALISVLLSLCFEMCKVTKLKRSDRAIITTSLLDCMLDIIESTRGDEEELFNYQTIKLILVFNEQFMMTQKKACDNLVLNMLARRMGTSNTFSENLFFMLNRSNDACVQLLILKLLYGIFTEPSLHEYFYTNDLFVLVDIILREVCNLGDEREAEALRDAYLRVLRPLLVNTQLKDTPYKRNEIHRLLCSIMTPAMHRPVDPITQRLIQKILEEWWVTVCEQPLAPLLGADTQGAVIEGSDGHCAILQPSPLLDCHNELASSLEDSLLNMSDLAIDSKEKENKVKKTLEITSTDLSTREAICT
ncbi:hypothetical protein BDF14DRAFT_1885122 [Spinellus fusiger]|nr:hypothetical protein BDF14DRAFT_1885122 [Spinellus fusiger]